MRMAHFHFRPCFTSKEIFTGAVRIFLPSVKPLIWPEEPMP